MSKPLPRTPPKPGINVWLVLRIGLLVFAALYATVQVSSRINSGHGVPGLPHVTVVNYFAGLLRGKSVWTSTHTVVGVCALVLAVALFVLLEVLLTQKTSGKTRTQAAAKHLGRADSMSLKAVEKRSVKSRLTVGERHGIMLLKTMPGAEKYVDFRSTGVAIMGPGAGKTTGLAIPMLLDAPGVRFATSNKRDLADAVRGATDGVVWVFDPQQICGKVPPPWRLDLLAYVTDEVRAYKLAKIWVDAATPDGAKKDSYFDTAGPNLLAGLLHAAAIKNMPISQVYKWLTNIKNRVAISILEEAGFLLPAMALQGVYDAPLEQRGGVFGVASEMVSFLNNTRVRAWLEKQGPDDDRPVFSPEDYVRSGNETMLALSKEGIGTTKPLTASLTIWVLDAAEEMADEFPHGRLPIPLTVILDEAANVCPIRELPNLYSHYGSRGIFPTTILQSWAQGVRVWGQEGMDALWTAATFCLVGMGQKDTAFLERISKSMGERYVTEYSTSAGGGRGVSRSVSHRLHAVMTVDDLVAMKPFETVALVSGEDPFVGKLVPWMARKEIADSVWASIAANEPKGLPVTV